MDNVQACGNFTDAHQNILRSSAKEGMERTKSELGVMIKSLNHYENVYNGMLQQISDVTNKVSNLQAKLDSLEISFKELSNVLIARQIGMDCDKKLLQFVFPDFGKQEFRIYSLHNLIKFLENPKSAVKKNLCDRDAETHWNNLSQEVRDQVQRRKNMVVNSKNLLNSIQALKSDCVAAHPPCKSYDEILAYFRDNDGGDGKFDCLLVCRDVYEKKKDLESCFQPANNSVNGSGVNNWSRRISIIVIVLSIIAIGRGEYQ